MNSWAANQKYYASFAELSWNAAVFYFFTFSSCIALLLSSLAAA